MNKTRIIFVNESLNHNSNTSEKKLNSSHFNQTLKNELLGEFFTGNSISFGIFIILF